MGKSLNKNSDYVQETLDKLAKTNPEAAMSLAKFLEGKNANAVAAALKIEEQRSGPSSIRELATRSLNNPDSPLPWYDLASIAINSELIIGPEEMKAFLSAHSMSYGLVLDSGDQTISDWYDKKLSQASEGDKDKWFIIKNDPVALLVWSVLDDSQGDLWDYYATEADWLSEALLFFSPNDSLDESNSKTSIEQSLSWIPEALEGLKKYHPLGQNIYLETVELSDKAPDDELEDVFAEASLLLTGLIKYGDIVVKATANNSGLSATDTLELILLNPEIFEPPEDESLIDDWAINHAAYLINLQKSRPTVWAAAHMRPQVLWLDKIAPHVSESLIINHGADDIQIFLFDIFDEDQDAQKAAETIDRFGDLAIYVFNSYQTNPDLALSLRQLGPRIVPFLLAHGPEGFELLTSEKGKQWLDKYFDEHGNQRSPEWIAAVPLIGGPAVVFKNWANGYPNTWGELGWAALDIVDGALLIASLGSSAPVSAAKQTGKSGLKVTARQIAKRGVQTTLSTAGTQGRRIAASDFTRAVTQYGTRRAGGFRGILFRTLARAKYLTVTATSVIWRVTATAVKIPAQVAWKTMAMVKRAWTSVPPQFRKNILKVIVAVSQLYKSTTLSQPAIDKVSEFLDSLPDKVNTFFKEFVDSLYQIIAGIISATIPSSAQSPILIFVMGVLILLFLLYLSRPKPVGLKRG
ncbi:MAG: hypothetical protein LBF38_00050 [Deltaproteobacteria bacterium]|nr:hypothetical protein [Deltaproteobacteria bacterium]